MISPLRFDGFSWEVSKVGACYGIHDSGLETCSKCWNKTSLKDVVWLYRLVMLPHLFPVIQNMRFFLVSLPLNV